MTTKIVPESFQVPEQLVHPKFIARKLCASDTYLDYIAVMSSIDLIRKTRGGSWPSPDLSFEEDMIDLAWHQREFEHRSSFAYTVMNPDETECLGCFYLYPAGYRSEADKEADVDVSFWVTQNAYKHGLYDELYKAIKEWLKAEWPFSHPHWSNKELPSS